MVKTHNPDIIVNCAAGNAVYLAEEEWRKSFSVNWLGIKHLVLAANEYVSIQDAAYRYQRKVGVIA